MLDHWSSSSPSDCDLNPPEFFGNILFGWLSLTGEEVWLLRQRKIESGEGERADEGDGEKEVGGRVSERR